MQCQHISNNSSIARIRTTLLISLSSMHAYKQCTHTHTRTPMRTHAHTHVGLHAHSLHTQKQTMLKTGAPAQRTHPHKLL
jgi:hypothetical protein